MNLLAAVLHIMVAAACVEFTSATCRSQFTCPCGKTGENVTYCSNLLSQNEDICQQWSRCQRCHPEINHCTECPPGYIGPTCLEVPKNELLVRPKRQYRYSDRSSTRRRAIPFAGGSSTCPNLQNTELVALQCIDRGTTRTCNGTCLTGYVFNGREDESQITLTCTQGRWAPTQAFPDCVSSGQCEVEIRKEHGGSYNCSMEMDGTRCDVICNAVHQGRYFCFPGREWEPLLPYCVKKKGNSVITDTGRPRCECFNGGTCGSNGRCICPAGRTGTKCEEVTCSNPGLVDNGYATYVGAVFVESVQNFKIGEKVDYYCYRGFLRQGPDSITCQTSGKWSRKPICTLVTTTSTTTTTTTTYTPARVNCQNPGAVDNGYAIYMGNIPVESIRSFKIGQTVKFYCDRGFTRQGPESVKCEASLTWSRKPTCVRVTTTSTTTTTTTTTTPAPVFCSAPGEVRNAYSLDMNGAPDAATLSHWPGQTVYFYCNEGFTIRGSDTITCQTSGKWTKKPTCVPQPTKETTTTTTTTPSPVNCPDPGVVRNANRVVINGASRPGAVYAPGHTFIYECKRGYTLDGFVYMTCLSSGRWSSEKPVCTTAEEPVPDAKYCLDPGSVVNGDRMSIPPVSSRVRLRGFRQGSQVMYSCNEGYQLQGVNSLYCTIYGEWSASKPTCEEIPRTGGGKAAFCRNPGPILNGIVDVFPPEGHTGRPVLEDDVEYPENTSLEYECDEGYTLTGSLSITCERDGFWSALTPSCIEDSYYESYCDNPGRLANGRVVVNAKWEQGRQPAVTDEGFRSGTRLQFYCDREYRLTGHSSATCEKDGKWSTSFPYCERDKPDPDELMYCDKPGSIANGKVRVFLNLDQRRRPAEEENPDEYPQWTRLQYSCEEGYELKGTPEITCGTNGFWSARAPTCEGECGKSSKMRTTQRIANGKPTEPGEWPWTVAIAVNRRGVSVVQCGGVLIDRRSILTAAHCFDTPGSFELYFGKYQRKTADDDRKVEKRTNLTVTINPSYNSTTFDSDIALVRFTPHIRYTDRIQPVCLPSPQTTAENLRLGKEGYVIGWGLNEKDLPSDALFMAYLPVLPGDYCFKAYQNQKMHLPITSNMYCAGFKAGGTSACSGDSGSPMVFYDRDMQHYTVEGLISFGAKVDCSSPERYTVLIKVLPYLPWVLRTRLTS